MRSIILPLILLSAVLAFAGYDVVNIQPGESHPIFPGVVKAVQLNVQGVSPTNGTVTIGEITKRWETFATNVVVTADGAETTLTKRVNGWGGAEGQQVLQYGKPQFSSFFQDQYYFADYVGDFPSADCYARTNDLIEAIFPGESFVLYGFTQTGPDEFEETGHSVTCRVDLVAIPNATTNTLWTVTAAGGSAVTNLPDKTFLETPANDWVRYGTATSGTVKLYVEY